MAGFTLVELLLVLAIIGVLSAVIVPSVVTSARRTGLHSTGNKLRELLDFASVSSISRRRPVVVSIDPERHICWASLRETVLPWLAEAGEEPVTRTLVSMEIPKDITVTVFLGQAEPLVGSGAPGAYALTFASDGSAEDALIELTDAHGGRVAFEIIGATGQVLVRESAGEGEPR